MASSTSTAAGLAVFFSLVDVYKEALAQIKSVTAKNHVLDMRKNLTTELQDKDDVYRHRQVLYRRVQASLAVAGVCPSNIS